MIRCCQNFCCFFFFQFREEPGAGSLIIFSIVSQWVFLEFKFICTPEKKTILSKNLISQSDKNGFFKKSLFSVNFFELAKVEFHLCVCKNGKNVDVLPQLGGDRRTANWHTCNEWPH